MPKTKQNHKKKKKAAYDGICVVSNHKLEYSSNVYNPLCTVSIIRLATRPVKWKKKMDYTITKSSSHVGSLYNRCYLEVYGFNNQ